MIPEKNTREQNEKLKEMNYNPEDDIFSKEDHLPLDGDGNPVLNESPKNLDENLDVPGAADDDQMEEIGSEDEENNYYSRSDNSDNHEETNDDILS